MENEFISVIIPVYNVEQYLEDCLDSVIKQSYKKLDIIIVNDGSTDNSLNICEKYAASDSRIRVVCRENGGLSAARNTGISLAQSQYITFIDSDDMIDRDMLRYLYLLLKAYHADMSVCQMQLIDEAGEKIDTKNKVQKKCVVGNKICMNEFFCGTGIGTVAWGKLYKTIHFDDVRYPYGKYHEDVYTTYKIIAQCDSISIGTKKMYLYRNRQESITKSDFNAKHLDAVKANLKRAKFIERYYPEMLVYAKAGIIYSCNQCALKISRQSKMDYNAIVYLQEKYRKYEKFYLKGKSRIPSKIFTVFAWIDLKMLIKILRIFNV